MPKDKNNGLRGSPFARPADARVETRNGWPEQALYSVAERMGKGPSDLYGIAVAIWLTLSIGAVVMSWMAWRSLANQVNLSVRVAGFNESLDGLFDLLQDAELNQNKYILTGDAVYLDRYRAASQNIPGEFEKLAGLAASDRDIQKQLTELRWLAELDLSQRQNEVQVRKERGIEAAVQSWKKGGGTKSMERIRALIGMMKLTRPNILTASGNAIRNRLRRAAVTSLGAGVVGVGMGFFAFFLSRVSYRHEKRERDLAEAALRAEHSDAQKSAFLASMSHEIRTPMNAILGFSDLLAGSVRTPKEKLWLGSIKTSAESLLQLINDVLDMSKIEAGALELHLEATDPREICDFVHTIFVEQAARRGVALSCKVSDDLHAALLMDRVRLRQILVNLVGNALKFTERGFVRVGIRLEPAEDSNDAETLLIEVEDTGVGIPPDKLDTIFKPFVQADARRPQEKQGTGLGLAIVKRLTELMGGSVSVASELGKGTLFRLRFPEVKTVVRESRIPKREAEDTADLNYLKPSRLVIVDDHEINRQLMAGIFETTHHEVYFGSSGEDAVSLAKKFRPDAILLDIRMPGMNGSEALSILRATQGFETLPVIAVTASSMAQDERELRNKFSGYVRKPFTRGDLFTELARFLGSSNHQREPQTASLSSPAETGPVVDHRLEFAALIAKLHDLKSKEWPAIRDSLAINETGEFASKLMQLGEAAGVVSLTSYAATLLRHADTYAVQDVERELSNFAKLVAEIENSSH